MKLTLVSACVFLKSLWHLSRSKVVLKARIHGATLRAILRATSVTRRGYTVATFRATLRAIFDQRLPSCHAMMFTSRNPAYEISSSLARLSCGRVR